MGNILRKTALLTPLVAFVFYCSGSQQVPDESFEVDIENPKYVEGEGPVVLVDEAHRNFHRIDGRYSPFAELLEQDGYVVKPAESVITPELLSECDIYVSSVPTSDGEQSGFTDEEIRFVQEWVNSGGSLLLITDHMPDPPAIAELAGAFGITVNNGYVLNEHPDEEIGPVYFRKYDGTLADHPITNGRSGFNERVDSVTSFSGCAFEAGENFHPLLIFGPYKTSWMTKEQDKFPPDTPKIDAEGWYQGGVMQYGQGRLAFFGEAGMFTAQIITAEGIRFGMNAPSAEQNPQFLLNVMHWLSGDL